MAWEPVVMFCVGGSWALIFFGAEFNIITTFRTHVFEMVSDTAFDTCFCYVFIVLRSWFVDDVPEGTVIHLCLLAATFCCTDRWHEPMTGPHERGGCGECHASAEIQSFLLQV